MTTYIDVHALQTVPPSLVNRDDTGAPKTATFGGFPRQRVSSQSWKRAIRRYFETHLDSSSVGFRTKYALELIVDEVQRLAPDLPKEQAIEGAERVFRLAKIKLNDPKGTKLDGDDTSREKLKNTGYLLFLSPFQITNIAQAVIDADKSPIKAADAKRLLNSQHSIDIACFGRMVADNPSFNVDAAVQVAHALGIHESVPEFDYFTAVDDVSEDRDDTGAGMLGTVQMMSSTLYRFATINVDSLHANLGSTDAANAAIRAFLEAFVVSMPTGKQNTFANNTLPELVYVAVRDDRSVSLVNAFEDPVMATTEASRRILGAERMAQEESEIEKNYGFVPRSAFVVALNDLGREFSGIATQTSLPDLYGAVLSAVSEAE
ncbi:type I-E CRISPR-associated protein Cas7/Cse4/CasC [Cutibacterium granulosum]|uniref:type I-E CRISPR-associated protein Cas7/Cse4/CasC n=1 Tax=Cutibacterium granulosum TaxID=33011 RepID=UPI0028048305|nr:type I-E CRISPR-associated protein Cas7/Cse4/CasC [Cutibacterium granulosum]MDU1580863.1 type I-E CRISPR-associated protein Cas7/Cse4/CasC [Cutibacterium granulosum]MDU1862433.1 type I-E CRISPR-associated protein Cas7/Cse4/CasC [Propionibacterium sp.]MEA5656532.1 type I-E CRISPR-associated protein Cas7/Cse4/CasC [Cutibacterium granulosum]